MISEEKLKSFSMRDIINYENACTLSMKYIENNAMVGDTGKYDAVYRLAGTVRDELYKEMWKRLEDLCKDEVYGVL